MTNQTFKEFPLSDEPLRCPCVDPDGDWVARVVRERLLADLDTRALRQNTRGPAGVRALSNARLRRYACSGGTQETF